MIMREEQGRYQLRKAAGLYWLLDMEQDGKEYRKPVSMNECGAIIWRELEKGCTTEEIGALLSDRYQIDREQAGLDIAEFLQQLKSFGILITEK